MTTSRNVLVDDERDQRIRWQAGERLPQLFEALATGPRRDAVAVDTGAEQLTFAELAADARRLARHLVAGGVRPGDRVAVLLDDPVRSYVAVLATGLVHAAYVPLDAAFPADRIAFILRDAEAATTITTARLARRLLVGTGAVAGTVAPVLVDLEAEAIAARDGAPLRADETGEPVDELAYLIYTSGTTGRPKGVAVEHASIVNFVRVAAEVYGFEATDRVYQGMTIAFDFSVEELWVPWLAGATVVPKPAGETLVGDELTAFLRSREVTALACVPTLLATLDERRLDALRLVLVSGEACPPDLVVRWWREGRRFLNVYGPTEATVTTTWTTLRPDRPVTLGRPLPTYSVVVLEPGDGPPRPVAPGQAGEIAVAGIGVARGYLHRPDKTAAAFVDDLLGVPGNPSGRLYRTGDLGVVTPDGEIEYHGRIDTQVKIRGYRIELTEIESVILGDPGVAAAVVDTHSPRRGDGTRGQKELVGYVTVRAGADVEEVRARVRDRLRDRLPGYMVPPYLEHLAVIPLTVGGKADRAALPEPTGARGGPAGAVRAPATATERVVTDALAAALDLEPDRLSTAAHVFDDLGASSLLLARFTTAARERGMTVSLREVYEHPRVVDLAAALDARGDVPGAEVAPAGPVRHASRLAIAATGAGQLLFAVAYLSTVAAVVSWAARFAAGGETGLAGAALRALVLAVTGVVVLVGAPIVLKWVLVGRWRETEFPVWTLRYVRFWIVKTLVRANPVALLFAGTPLYSVYLRALGARVGPRALILTNRTPIATDLIAIGADAVVSKDVTMSGYAVTGQVLRTGRVHVGDRAYVGEGSVLEPGTAIGDDAGLAHASSLAPGAHVPDGQHWLGVPGRRAAGAADHRPPTVVLGRWRRLRFGLLQAAQVVAIIVPLAVLALEGAVEVGVGDVLPAAGGLDWLRDGVIVSAVSYGGAVLLMLLAAVVLPRLLGLLIVPGRVHPLYGLRYAALRAVQTVGNRPFADSLFGDSSAVTRWLRALGWDLGVVEQTGSNFGTAQRQDLPSLSRVGTGTMISDGLSMANVEFSASSFRALPVQIGARNFLGNRIVYPAGGRTGDNVLLATKVMVPLDGEVRTDTGLLGSPPFAIPRTVQRPGGGARPADDAEQRRRALPAKNRHNATTAVLLLLARWVQVLLITLLFLAAAALYPVLGALAVGLALGLAPLLGLAWLILVERATLGFRRLVPRTSSIYDRAFWRHERLWKLLVPGLAMLDGTPFKSPALRALGVRVGRGLFDDGSAVPEHTLVSLGDYVTLNAGATLQCHSLEDGSFASDRTELGDDVTVGTAAFVHYGVTMRAGSVLDADAFLMKGSTVPAGARWDGNPAAPATGSPPALDHHAREEPS